MCQGINKPSTIPVQSLKCDNGWMPKANLATPAFQNNNILSWHTLWCYSQKLLTLDLSLYIMDDSYFKNVLKFKKS